MAKVSRFPNNCGVRIVSGFSRNQSWFNGSYGTYQALSDKDAKKEAQKVTNRITESGARFAVANLLTRKQSKMIKALMAEGWKKFGVSHRGAGGTITWLYKKRPRVF